MYLGIAANDHLPDHSLQQFVNNLTNRPVRFHYEAFAFEGKQVGVIKIEQQQARPLYLKCDYGKLKKIDVYVQRAKLHGPHQAGFAGRDCRDGRGLVFTNPGRSEGRVSSTARESPCNKRPELLWKRGMG